MLNVMDEFTGERLAIEVDRTIDAKETVKVFLGQPPRRQRPRADCYCSTGMVPARLHRHRLHRAGLALAEPSPAWTMTHYHADLSLHFVK